MRLRKLAMLVVPLIAVPITLFSGSSPASATSGLQCASSSTYGSSCINVIGSKMQVQDIAGYFTAPTRDYLTGKYWKFELTQYSCNPVGNTKAQCPPTHTWYSNRRYGNPPKGGTVCDSISVGGQYGSYTHQQCVDYGEAQVLDSHGDFPSYYTLPHTYSVSPTYLCMEIAVLVSGSYRDNGAVGSKGVRGCATVHT